MCMSDTLTTVQCARPHANRSSAVPSSHSFWDDAFVILSGRKLLLLEPHSALAMTRVTTPYCKRLERNNCRTGNMRSYLCHLISRLRKYSFPAPSEDQTIGRPDVVAAANGLYIGRTILHHLAKHSKPDRFVVYFCQQDLTWKERNVVEDSIGSSGTAAATVVGSENENDAVSKVDARTIESSGRSDGENQERMFPTLSAPHSSVLFELLEVLVKILCQGGDASHLDHLRSDASAQVAIYVLRLEVLHMLLVLFSTSIYHPKHGLANFGRSPLGQILRSGNAKSPGGGRWARTLIPSLLKQISCPNAPSSSAVIHAIRVAAAAHQDQNEATASSSSCARESATDSVRKTSDGGLDESDAKKPPPTTKSENRHTRDRNDDIDTKSSKPMDDEEMASRGTGVASSAIELAASVLKMPLHLFYMVFATNDATDSGRSRGDNRGFVSRRRPPSTPLSDRCLLLLLVLIHSSSGAQEDVDDEEEAEDEEDIRRNPYKKAFCSLADAAAPSKAGSAASSTLVRVSFARIYALLSDRARMQSPQGVLFLYSLLQWNHRFREYVMSRSDPESILIPLLEQLHRPEQLTASQLYLLIILVLIFTQDGMFNDNAHRRVHLPKVPWFTRRIIRDISLGSLTFVVLLGVLQFNMAKLQDPHVHTYCMAALANMGPHCYGLHSHAADKLVGIVKSLSRKYVHLQSILAASPRSMDDAWSSKSEDIRRRLPRSSSADSNVSVHSSTLSEKHSVEELKALREGCEEILRTLMNLVLQCISSRSLRHNPRLAYALLQEKAAFEHLRSDSVWGSIILPLLDALDYLYASLEDSRSSEDWSYDGVLDILRELCATWKGPDLPEPVVSNEEMKSRYEEASGAESFFRPCVWRSVVSYAADVDWEPGLVGLFDEAEESNGDASRTNESAGASKEAKEDGEGEGLSEL
eukprot:g2459.t1